MLFAIVDAVSATNTVDSVSHPSEVLAACVGAPLEQGRALMDRTLDWLSRQGVDFALNAAIALVILLIGGLALRFISAAVCRALTCGGKRRTLFTNFISSVIIKVGWAMLIIMALGRLGVDVAPLIAGLGVTGFIVGFACQESLGNLASGMMIAINEPFKVGDFISAGGFEGTVLEVNMMATVLATSDNKRITIPNKNAWGSPITNYAALGRRRVDMQVGIAYGADVARALEIIRETVAQIPGVLPEPAPAIAVAGLDASAVTINIRPWAASGDYWRVYSATLQAVKTALDAHGIEIPFPQVVVHTAP
ncbi:MAG: mechanosensitive ion channel family protein [Kiritimatiellia bacterium]